MRKAANRPLNFTFVAGPDQVAEKVNSAVISINTDDRPLLEFRTPVNHVDMFRKTMRQIQ